MVYRTLSRNAKKLMILTAALQGAVFVGFCLLLIFSHADGALRLWLSAAAAAAALLWVGLTPALRFCRYRWGLAADRLEIIEGVLWVSRTVVPIDRVYQINRLRGPLDSLFGLAKVTVITAGSRATIRFLTEEQADQLTNELNAGVEKSLNGGGGDV